MSFACAAKTDDEGVAGGVSACRWVDFDIGDSFCQVGDGRPPSMEEVRLGRIAGGTSDFSSSRALLIMMSAGLDCTDERRSFTVVVVAVVNMDLVSALLLA